MKSIEKLAETESLRSNLPITDAKSLQHMSDILSVLSKADALQIFVLAKNGLKSELDTPQKIGLTKKQYYTRLKQLYDLNLITKKEDVYLHTSFGNLVYGKHIIGFLQTVSNIKELEMIDVLKRSSRFNNDEISEFLTRINPKIASSEESGRSTVVTTTFDGMVSKVLEMIEFSKSEILIASRFSNDLIINAVLKKSTAGVKVRILADNNTVRSFFASSGKSVSRPDKNEQERNEVVANPFYPSNIQRKYVNTPFSLIIVDGKHVGMEVVDNYNPTKFQLSVHSEDVDLARQIMPLFDRWWNEATQSPPQTVSRTSRKN